ncbi:MAG: hypothetical protein NZU63_14055 [Gemmataceae bacterium]|nr:hypothetical protein [Gemmataceae bacterium]MDW8244754.1 hypothetical protein [Thermogemmata sp.]
MSIGGDGKRLGVLLAVLLGSFPSGRWLRADTPGEPQAVLLREEPQTVTERGYSIVTTVTGVLFSQAEGQRRTLPVEGQGQHELTERILASEGGLPLHTLRHYKAVVVEVRVGGEKLPKVLRAERRCIVFGRLADGSRGFSPHGPLTRDELETVSEHLPPAVLTSLLPGKVVRVGDKWKISDPLVSELCLLDAVTSNQTEGELQAIKDGIAEFIVRGKVDGIDKGASVRLVVEGRGRFDLKDQRLIDYQWEQNDEREAGWWNPAAQLRIRVQVRCRAAEPLPPLCQALVDKPQVWSRPEPTMLALQAEGPAGRYRLLYDRHWYVVGQTDSHLVLRYVEQGTVLAQVTLTNWRKASTDRDNQLAEFRKAVAATPGWKAEKTHEEKEIPGLAFRAFRIIQEGQIGQEKMIQRFWLLTSEKGEQVVVTTTVPLSLGQRFGDKDTLLLRGLTF